MKLESSLSIFRTLPTPVRFLVLGTLINNLGAMSGPFLAIIFVKIFRMSPAEAAWISASYAFGSFTAVVCGGVLTDRIGRRGTLMISLFGAGIVGIVVGSVREVRLLHGALMLFGFFTDLYRPASTSLTADLLPSEQRSNGFAAMRTALNLGGFVAVSLGGLLIDWDWRLLFWLDGLTSAAFGLVVYKYISEPDHTQAGTPQSIRSLPPWKNRAYLATVFMCFMTCMVYASHAVALPLTYSEHGMLSNRIIGITLGINGLLVVLLEMPIVKALNHKPNLLIASIGVLALTIGLGLTPVSSTLAWYLLTTLIWTVGEILCFPFLTTYIANTSPEDRRGQYVSYYQLSWKLALTINPLVCLPLYQAVSQRAFWGIHVLVGLPSVVYFWFLYRRTSMQVRA